MRKPVYEEGLNDERECGLARCVVGIDVAKKKVDAAAVLNGRAKSKIFDNTPAGHAELPITLEFLQWQANIATSRLSCWEMSNDKQTRVHRGRGRPPLIETCHGNGTAIEDV